METLTFYKVVTLLSRICLFIVTREERNGAGRKRAIARAKYLDSSVQLSPLSLRSKRVSVFCKQSIFCFYLAPLPNVFVIHLVGKRAPDCRHNRNYNNPLGHCRPDANMSFRTNWPAAGESRESGSPRAVSSLGQKMMKYCREEGGTHPRCRWSRQVPASA